MKLETTPQMITTPIATLCRTISSSLHPQYIKVQPAPESSLNNCFSNVETFISKNGGSRVLGWAIWQRANLFIEAEAHAVWKSPQNELIDITPHSHNEQTILFLEDSSLQYHGNLIPNIRVPLTSSPLVAEFIELFDSRDHIAMDSPGDCYALPSEMYMRMVELEKLFLLKVGRNEPCPCGSGLKYKRCCGQFE